MAFSQQLYGSFGKSPRGPKRHMKRVRKAARKRAFGVKKRAGPGVLKGVGSQSVWKGFGGSTKKTGGVAGLARVMGGFGGKRAKSSFSNGRKTKMSNNFSRSMR